MVAEVFPDIPPSIDTPGKSTEFSVLEASFGDGYVQAAADGINNIREEWQLSWSGITDVEGSQIVAFLNSHGGYKAFRWTPPRAAEFQLYRCTTFTDVPLGPEGYLISATFVRFYGPEPV
ncbi:MAG: phage tail protein [Gammaproteobacteria bacterium]|nr:phage tail protein [Gammaproteobacteria bacterium]